MNTLLAVNGSNVLWFLIGVAVVAFPLALIIVSITRKPKGSLQFCLLFSNIKTAITMVKMRNNQFVQGTLEAKDAKGDAAQIEAGSVKVSSDDEGVATLEQDPDDEKKIKVVGQRAGATVVRISADADLGEGVKTIETQVAVEIEAGEATGFGISFGDPQDQEA